MTNRTFRWVITTLCAGATISIGVGGLFARANPSGICLWMPEPSKPIFWTSSGIWAYDQALVEKHQIVDLINVIMERERKAYATHWEGKSLAESGVRITGGRAEQRRLFWVSWTGHLSPEVHGRRLVSNLALAKTAAVFVGVGLFSLVARMPRRGLGRGFTPGVPLVNPPIP